MFLSGRAVYILVYNLNKNLLARAEPIVRQGVNDIRLDNPNNETNLDNLLSWLASIHNMRSDTNKNVTHQGTKQSYLRPPVIIVGTNLDQPFEEVKTAEKHIKDSIQDKTYSEHVILPYFAVDNTTEIDTGVQKLRHKIMEVLKDESFTGAEVPLRYEGQFYPISLMFCSSYHFIKHQSYSAEHHITLVGCGSQRLRSRSCHNLNFFLDILNSIPRALQIRN